MHTHFGWCPKNTTKKSMYNKIVYTSGYASRPFMGSICGRGEVNPYNFNCSFKKSDGPSPKIVMNLARI